MTAALPVKRIFSLKPRSQTPFHQCSHYPQTCGFQRFKAPNLRRSTESCGAPQMATADPNTAAPRRPNLRLSEAKRPGNAAAKRHGAGRSVWNIGMS